MQIPPDRLMEIQIRTLYLLDDSGRLQAMNEPGNPWVPMFFLGRTTTGNLRRYRYDLPETLVSELDALAEKETDFSAARREPVDTEPYRILLDCYEPILRIWTGPAWRIPDDLPPSLETVSISRDNAHLLTRRFEWLVAELEARQPCIAVVRDGIAVSICFCARLSAEAAEAGVETLEPYRGNGYAPMAVASWADAVRHMNRLPLYSTSWDNLASQRVAQKLRMELYGEDIHLT